MDMQIIEITAQTMMPTHNIQQCLPDSLKQDSPKLGLGFRVRYRVRVTIRVSANRVSANRDWTHPA